MVGLCMQERGWSWLAHAFGVVIMHSCVAKWSGGLFKSGLRSCGHLEQEQHLSFVESLLKCGKLSVCSVSILFIFIHDLSWFLYVW